MRRRPLFSTAKLDAASVDLTPLIDVVFVVLIVFMLIAPLVDVDRIDLATGGVFAEPAHAGGGGVTIRVFHDGALFFGRKPVSVDELKELLHTYPSRMVTPQLICDEKAPFGTYQQVKNIVEEEGFATLDIVVKSRK